MPKFNPYIVGTPITTTDAFYGREKVINVVRDTLSIGTINLIVFFGQKRIGKTSLAQNLKNQSTLEDFIFVYSDSNEIAGKKPFEVLHYLSQKINQAVDLAGPGKSDFQKDISLFQKDFLPKIYKKLNGKRLVLILDEFDIFERKRESNAANQKDRSNSTISLLDNLIENEPDLVFIIVLARGQQKLGPELTHTTRAAYWVKVSLLEPADTEKLITKPAQDILNYLPDAVERVMFLTSGHPYYIQLLCYEIFNELQMANKGQEVRTADVEKAAERALNTGQGGFGWLWKDLSPAEKLISALLAEAAERQPEGIITEERLSHIFETSRIHRAGIELTEALGQLIELDIIKRKGGNKYRFVVEIIRRWICTKHPLAQERDENLPLLSKRAVAELTLGQSADTLDQGITHYKAAVAANPNHVQAQLALAEALFNKGHIDEAVEAYQAAYWLDEAKAKKGLEKAQAALSKLRETDTGPKLNPIVVGVGVIVLLIAIALAGVFIFNLLNGAEATATPKPEVPPTPTATPTEPSSDPGDTYEAPVLLSPTLEEIIPANEDLILKWSGVGNLTNNEHYAVRLIFIENGKRIFDGDQLQATNWAVPRDFLQRADGPAKRFEWFVFVERVEEDGQTLPVSPESETRSFYWR